MISQRFGPLTLGTVLLTGLAFAFFSCVSGKGRDLVSVGRFLLREIRRYEDLSDKEEMARRNDHDKLRIAEEVIAGRMTLRQAAGEFEALQHERLGERYDILMRTVREVKGGACDFRHDVITWVQLSLANKPAQAAAVVDRLEKEEYGEGVRGQEFAHGS
jgi:hypothetical protein